MKWIKKNLTYNTLFLILTLFCYQNSYSQFIAYSAQGTPSDPDCAAISSGTEIWGGMGVMSISQCVNAQIPITNYTMVPYGPGWFGDDQGELYWYDGAKWKQPFNTTCGSGGGGCSSPLTDTIYVSTTGDDGSGTGSQTCPYASLSKAISASAAGKVIKLESGSYTISTAITLGTSNDYQLTIVGGSSNAATTILRGGGSNRLIYGSTSSHNGSNEAWTWKNLTIRNFTATATGSGGDGAAFRISTADGWSFENVIFYANGSNASNVDGGVFYLLNVGSTNSSDYWNFTKCIFDGNYVTSSGEDGGAVRLYNAYVNFNRCIFRNNKADDFGGAVYLNTKGITKFYDCLFYKNWTETDDGGAVAALGSSSPYLYTYFINCTFSQNTAGAGTTYSTTNSTSGAKGGAFYGNSADNYTYFYNTIAYGNDGYSNDREDISRGNGYFYFYNSCIGSANANGQGSSNGTISTTSPYNNLAENTDPLFNDIGADDYSIIVSSPAKNKGSNSTIQGMTPTNVDLAGNPRSPPYDIGSYEYQDCAATTPTITISESSGNTNNDGTICNGGTVTLSTTGYVSYEWSSTGTSNSEVVTPTTNTTYTVTVIDNNGCTATNTQDIVVTDLPTPTITFTETSGTTNDGTVCSGDAVNLDGGSYTSYSWSHSLGSSQTATANPTAPTTYSVSVTDGNGCVGTDDQLITAVASPSISGVSSGNVIPGSTLSFDATITDCVAGSSSGPHDFSTTSGWSSGTGFGSNTIQSCNGYSFRDNAYSSYPDVYFNNSTSFFTSNGGDITVTFQYKCYDYDSPNGPTSTTDHKGQFVEYGTSASGPWSTVYVMADYTASATCVLKSFTFTPTAGQPVYLRFHTLWGSGDFWASYDDIRIKEGGCIYSWSGPNSYSATTEDITVTTTASSSHAGNYSLTATNSDGCATTATATITVNCPISVDAGSDITVSEMQSIELDATVSCSPNTGTIDTEDIGSGNYTLSQTTITTTPGGFWSNVSGYKSWFGESNYTGTGNNYTAGPSAPNTGDDYIYVETSSGYAYSSGDIAYLRSNPISQGGVIISFYYHMCGSDIGTLSLESYDGSSWTERWSLSGQQQISQTDAWIQANVDLSSYTVTQLRFKYVADGGYMGDAALDDIIITYNQQCEYTWTTNAANGNAGWSATNTEDITVTSTASSTHQGTYTLSVTNGVCTSVDNVGVTVLTGPPTWVGGTNSDWTEASNWQNNVVPTGSSDVIIGSGSNIPAVTTNVNINSLTIENGGSLTIANTSGSGTQFIVSKNLTVNGTLSVTGDVPLHLTGAGLLFGEYGDITCGGSSNTTNMKLKISGLYNIASDLNMKDLEITGTLNGQTYTVGINGDWKIASSGTFTAGTGKITFNGNGIQNVTTKGQNFNNVEINNTNNPIAINVIDGMILGNNGVLKLTDGVIKTVGTAPFAKVVIKNNEPNAIVGSDGTPHNLTPSSYVWGNLKRHTKSSGYSGKQKYEFPIGIVPPGGGSSARYYRTRVDFTGLQGVSNITARFIVGNHPAYTSETDFANEEYEIPYTDSTQSFKLARMLGEGYWRIHPNQQPTSGDYDVVLYTGVFDSQGSSGKTAPIKTDTSNTAVNAWAVAGNLAADNSSNRQNSHGKIKSYNLTSFSDFGIGDGGGAALPIELLTFTVIMEVDKAKIEWATATEINNDYFTIERTLDGINFEEVVEMAGAGNSFEPLSYVAYDDYPLPGTSYYRLKQTDYDGQFEYSGMVELYNPYISNVDLYEVVKVGDNIKIEYNLIKETTYNIIIYDMMGKIISEVSPNSTIGINQHYIDISSYTPGNYFVTLHNSYEVHSSNIVITH